MVLLQSNYVLHRWALQQLPCWFRPYSCYGKSYSINQQDRVSAATCATTAVRHLPTLMVLPWNLVPHRYPHVAFKATDHHEWRMLTTSINLMLVAIICHTC